MALTTADYFLPFIYFMRMNRYYFMLIKISKVSYVGYVSDKFTDHVSFHRALHHLVELYVCSGVAKYLKNLRMKNAARM